MRAISRRRFLELAMAVPCMYSAPLYAASAPVPDSRFQGCFLRAGSDDFLDKLTLRLSSNDKEVDQVCVAAERNLRREFRVSPDTWFYDDETAPNAFATWLLRRGFKGDGTVCLGLGLVRKVTRRNELNRRWKVRLTAIMAHEWAHIVQYSRGHRLPGKSTELHADFLAGWFLSRTGAAQDVSADKQRDEAMYRIFFLGDYNYGDPDHHGTPIERASVITQGFDLAAKVNNVDAAYRARSLNG